MEAIYVVSVEESRELEDQAVRGGTSIRTLMEEAGRAVARAVANQMGFPNGARVLVLVGPGNNGGDGLVAACELARSGYAVHLYLWKRSWGPEEEGLFPGGRDAATIVQADDDPQRTVLANTAEAASAIVDALLGVGLNRPLEGDIVDIIATIQPHWAKTVAVDVPTGTGPDDGEIYGTAVRAALTVTMGYCKWCHFVFPAAGMRGRLLVADIGLPRPPENTAQVLTPELVAGWLPPRPQDAHKGTFGRAMVVGGSYRFPGAPMLAAHAALRAGAGLVCVAMPRSAYNVNAGRLPEAIYLPLPEMEMVVSSRAAHVLLDEVQRYTGLLLGPGLTTEVEAPQFVREVLGIHGGGEKPPIGFAPPPARREDRTAKLPATVLDADGLNCVAGLGDWWTYLPERCVLTPHPGELSRLTGLETREIQRRRPFLAREISAQWRAVLILKGAYTLVADPSGRLAVNTYANPALATAGSGDVLAGLVVGFLAQGIDPFRAATVATFVHAEAAERLANARGNRGILAGDLAGMIPEVLRDIEAGRVAPKVERI